MSEWYLLFSHVNFVESEHPPASNRLAPLEPHLAKPIELDGADVGQL